MLITSESLRSLTTGYAASFKKGFDGAETHYRDVAMVVPSSTSSNTYGWLGQFPKMREWIGDRVVKSLLAHGYAVENRKFESTIEVPRTSIEDDQFGVFSPIIEEMGKAAAEFPDELSFALLRAGFETLSYDKQYFFSPNHMVIDPLTMKTYSASNMQAGTSPPWFLLDTSRAMKPLLYQERIPYKFTALNKDEDENVFWRDSYVYGTRTRSNVGFGLWQLAFASKAELTPENYAAARASMMNLSGDEGRVLGIKPTLLVVPPDLEEAARMLINNDVLPSYLDSGAEGAPITGRSGGTNPWKGSAKLIVTSWVK
ncbi:Mu-like prophage major head subunit gpT family protein [Methylobacterium sp. Leaf85]|uniref:Mu-like prophage major head subunit gpT family protein n=1 Tax=Methylobacterium sp. Leaf85 TaxID=1736241 RepID=UPI0009E82FD0|nr:Mu-like prophage major head subunit gpT family protein [Methylobacterium sp. Leaf85]